MKGFQYGRPQSSLYWLSCTAIAICIFLSWAAIAVRMIEVAQTIDLGRAASDAARRNAETALRSRELRSRIEPSQVVPVNKAIDSLNVPWRDILDDLEVAQPNSVGFLSIQPNVEAHAITVGAEAANPGDMLAFISSLKSQPQFDRVHLVSHELYRNDPALPYRFSITAEWIDEPRAGVPQ